MVVTEVDPDVSAAVIVALWDGLQVQWLLDDRRAMSPAMESYLTTLEPAEGDETYASRRASRTTSTLKREDAPLASVAEDPVHQVGATRRSAGAGLDAVG